MQLKTEAELNEAARKDMHRAFIHFAAGTMEKIVFTNVMQRVQDLNIADLEELRSILPTVRPTKNVKEAKIVLADAFYDFSVQATTYKNNPALGNKLYSIANSLHPEHYVPRKTHG